MDESIQPVEDTTENAPVQEQTQTDEPTEVGEDEGRIDDQPEAETTNEGEVSDGDHSSKRLERRFAKMSDKIRQLSEQQQFNQPVEPPGIPLNQEVTYDQYQAEVSRQAQALTEIKLQQFRQEQQVKERAETFDRDVDYIERKFPELNEDSNKYDPKLSEKIAGMYERLSAKNPQVRLRDIVRDVMDIADRKSARTSAKVTAAVAKQSAETAVQTQTTTKPGKKDFAELSIKEMEQQLGVVE